MIERPSLEALVGQDIGILARRISPEQPIFSARLHAVEPSGLWIESQNLTEIVLESLDKLILEATPVFFFPFEMIECVFSVVDSPAISEQLGK